MKWCKFLLIGATKQNSNQANIKCQDLCTYYQYYLGDVSIYICIKKTREINFDYNFSFQRSVLFMIYKRHNRLTEWSKQFNNPENF